MPRTKEQLLSIMSIFEISKGRGKKANKAKKWINQGCPMMVWNSQKDGTYIKES